MMEFEGQSPDIHACHSHGVEDVLVHMVIIGQRECEPFRQSTSQDPVLAHDQGFEADLAVDDLGDGKVSKCDMLAIYDVNEEGKITAMSANWDFDELMAQLAEVNQG